MEKAKLAVLLGSLLGFGTAQAATIITFDPDGTGADSAIQVGTFDWSPDNALAVGASPLDTNPKPFVIYSQGSLGNFLDANGAIIQGTGLHNDYEITFQAAFGEIGQAGQIGNTITSVFSLDPNTNVNYFKIFWDDTIDANPATGDGYGDGMEILNAVVIENNSNFSIVLDANGGFPLDDLDKYDGNDQPGYGTLVGQGGGQLAADVSSYDTDFFKVDFDKIVLDLFFNTSHVTPFHQVEPTGPATAVSGVVGNIPNFGGAGTGGYNYVNGLNGSDCERGGNNCDFLFQADANQSFEAQAIPEPASLALLGLGLAAMGGAGFRRRRKA